MRALYTKPVFEEIVSTSAGEIEQRFTADRWVWGESPQSSIGSAQLRAAVIDLYEKDYIAAWDDLLEDIELVSLPGDVDRTRRVLTTLAGTASPLRGLLEAVDANTHLLPPPGATQGGAVSTVRGRIEQIEQYLGAGRPAGGVPTVTPGAQVTAHFKPVHDLVVGEPGKAPIDGLLDQIRQLAARLGPGGGSGPLGAPDIATAAAVAGMSEELKARAKGLPGGVAGLMVAAGESAHRAAVGGATSEIENQYQQDVVRRCRAALSGRYPFVPGSPTDVQIADFSDIFAPGGAFDTFFKTRLQQLVNTTRSPWTWHTDASGTSVGLRNGQFVLRQFYAAQQIREMFFPAGSSTPEVRFVLTPFFLDPQATLFRLELDGQKLEYRHDAERDYRFEWPGEAPGGVIASFEGAGGRPNIALRSPWAWFRLLEGRLRAETDGSFMLTVQAGGRTAQVRVRPLSNVRHPFGKPDLQNFRCEP
jgi:type VI secretion system protein ImpL